MAPVSADRHRAGVGHRGLSIVGRRSSRLSRSSGPSAWPGGATGSTLSVSTSTPISGPRRSWRPWSAELGGALAARQEALRTEPHHHDEQDAEDQEVELRTGSGTSGATRSGSAGRARSGTSCRCRLRTTAPASTPQMFPMPPRMTMISDQDRGRELEEVGGRGAQVGRLERTGDAGEAGTEGEREELGPDGVDAHHLGGDLVLADGAPRRGPSASARGCAR